MIMYFNTFSKLIAQVRGKEFFSLKMNQELSTAITFQNAADFSTVYAYKKCRLKLIRQCLE